MSPLLAYRLNETIGSCEKNLCQKNLVLKWFYPENTQLNILFTKMSGNICGSYGIIIRLENGTEIDICYDHHIYSVQVSQGSVVDVVLWFDQSAINEEVLGTIWIGTNGAVPSLETTQKEHESLMAKLVHIIKTSFIFEWLRILIYYS